MKINDLKVDFEKYISNLENAQVYKEKLINHFNYNSTWQHLRKLTISEYISKYGHLTGKSFYIALNLEGFSILESDSGNRDAYSNVHSHLKKFFKLKQFI